MKLKRAQILDLTGRTHDRALVGVLIQPHDPRIGHLLDRFAELHWQVIDLNAYSMHLPEQLKLRGAIVTCLPTDRSAQRLLERGVPTVRLGSFVHPGDRRVPAILPDMRASGRLAADHFAERGFIHLGFVGYDPWHDAQVLYEGFHERAVELGCQCHLLKLDENEIYAQRTERRGFQDIQRECVQAWWRQVPKPLGLLASGDMAGHQFCQWAMEANLNVPEDIAILGRGNITLTCDGAIVPLSSIDRNEAVMLDTAIETLGRLIAGETIDPPTILIPPHTVVTRRSTDVLAASDPHVVKALRFVWDHVAEDLSVDQIAGHVDISRRALERAFRREISRGINQEFQRRKLDRARELLLGTQMSVAEIASSLGISSAQQFCRVFGSTYGQSPAQYRRAHRA